MSSHLKEIQTELQNKKDPERAACNAWFFKTGPGEYGEGDQFLGIRVPEQRKLAKKYKNLLTIKETEKLLHSKWHEQRLTALFILIYKYQKKEKDKKVQEKKQEEIYKLYLNNTKWINNWDLIDTTSHHIVGGYLHGRARKQKEILYTFAKSKDLWKKRIAIISTYNFIKHFDYDDTIKISKILLKDKHDLIHKAVGWMLREIGNRDRNVEEEFLKKHYKTMPRTMLRYAIEKFPERRRKAYLKGEL